MKKLEKSHFAYALAIVALYGFCDWRGVTFDGKERPPLSTVDLRQTSPGSWTYTYWSLNHHGK